jgi:hypothetical protein
LGECEGDSEVGGCDQGGRDGGLYQFDKFDGTRGANDKG